MRRWRCDDAATTAEDTAVTIARDVLANDSDLDGDALTASPRSSGERQRRHGGR